jgi:Flp pilus assembly pilin Flp
MKKLVIRCLRDESGQDLIEYGLLIGIITTAAITAIGLLGPRWETRSINGVGGLTNGSHRHQFRGEMTISTFARSRSVASRA